MNIYILTLLEIIIYSSISYFLGTNILKISDNENAMKLNYIFWIFIIILTLFINFHLYLYFVSAFVIGIIIISIFIKAILGTDFFVEDKMSILFWILFTAFFITLLLVFITKRMLLTTAKSEPLQGLKGNQGDIGIKGEDYFIEQLNDRAYVYVILELEKFFKEILDDNEIDYDKNEIQFKNMFLKENIKRILESPEFLKIYLEIYNNSPISKFNYECKVNDQKKRICKRIKNTDDSSSTLSTSDNPTKSCQLDIDCHTEVSTTESSTNLSESDILSEVFNKKFQYENGGGYTSILDTFKEWFRIYLLNNCDEDDLIYKKFKLSRYNKLEKHGYSMYTSNLRLNSTVGRKFLQSRFDNDTYWNNPATKKNKNNINKIIDIKKSPLWNWGSIKNYNNVCEIDYFNKDYPEPSKDT